MRAHIVASVFMATLVAAPLAAQDLEFPAGFDEPMPMHHDGRASQSSVTASAAQSGAQQVYQSGGPLNTCALVPVPGLSGDDMDLEEL